MKLILVSLLLVATSLFGGDDRKLVPDLDAQRNADKVIRDTFKKEFAKYAPEDRKALAEKLTTQGVAAKSDAGTQYVMLREALILAGQSGDVDTISLTAANLAKHFNLDVVPLKLEALAKANTLATTKEKIVAIYHGYMETVKEALAEDKYDGAAKAATAAEGAARRAQEMPLVADATARAKDLRELAAEYAKVKFVQKTLAEKPDDPEANLVVGKFYCFKKDQWKQGLPMLAKGSDPKLKDLATKELTLPIPLETQLVIPPTWWEIGEKLTGSAKLNVQHRAARWYKLIRNDLPETARPLANERVIASAQAKRGGGEPPVLVISKTKDAKGLEIGGLKDANFTPQFCMELWVKTKETSGYLLTKRQKAGDTSLTLHFEGGQPYVVCEGPDYKVHAFTGSKINDGIWHHLAVVKVAGDAQLYVDGKKRANIKGLDKMTSGSAWIVGYNGVENKGALDAEFCGIRISSVVRYTDEFAPTKDYCDDLDTLLFK